MVLTVLRLQSCSQVGKLKGDPVENIGRLLCRIAHLWSDLHIISRTDSNQVKPNHDSKIIFFYWWGHFYQVTYFPLSLEQTFEKRICQHSFQKCLKCPHKRLTIGTFS